MPGASHWSASEWTCIVPEKCSSVMTSDMVRINPPNSESLCSRSLFASTDALTCQKKYGLSPLPCPSPLCNNHSLLIYIRSYSHPAHHSNGPFTAAHSHTECTWIFRWLGLTNAPPSPLTSAHMQVFRVDIWVWSAYLWALDLALPRRQILQSEELTIRGCNKEVRCSKNRKAVRPAPWMTRLYAFVFFVLFYRDYAIVQQSLLGRNGIHSCLRECMIGLRQLRVWYPL